jgi:hypothetical protein
MPVKRARAVKNTPTSADAAARRSHRSSLRINQITPPTSVTPNERKASHADGTWTNMMRANSP